MAAMIQAYKDGMHVINLSLGGGSSWPGYPDAALADALATRGLIVVAAMGNDGDKGLWEASSPAVAKRGTAVASFDNSYVMGRSFYVNGDRNKTFRKSLFNQNIANFDSVFVKIGILFFQFQYFIIIFFFLLFVFKEIDFT